MDFPILIIFMSPLSCLGASGVCFFHLLMKIMQKNAASHLCLICLPVSHKKDARLIWVEELIIHGMIN